MSLWSKKGFNKIKRRKHHEKNVQAPRDVVRKLYRRADSRIMECEGWRFHVAGTKAQLCGRKQHIFSCAGGISRFANVAKKVAEKALRRDANRTTCLAFYQPKAPTELKRFKSSK